MCSVYLLFKETFLIAQWNWSHYRS